MPLTEQRRTQLDGIVQQMVRNRESDDNIQWVVNDFKQKYNNEVATQPQPEKSKGILSKASDIADKTLGKASDVMFGSTGKAVGGLITSAIGSAAQLAGKEQVLGADAAKLRAAGEEQATPGNIAFTALELYPGGGFVSKALKGIPGGAKVAEVLAKVPENLRAKAVKQYAEALGATKEEFKKLTQKVVPGLLDRGVKAKNLEGLATKASKEAKAAGIAVGEFVEKIPGETISSVKPVIEKLQKMKQAYVVDGKVVNAEAVNAIDRVADVVSQFGETVSQKSLIQVRRILDESVAAGKGFVKDKITNFSDRAEKAAADIIREILEKDTPDLAKLNSEFAFWNNVKNITKETLKRKSTQGGGLSQVISSVAGGAAGAASGQGLAERTKNAVIGAVIGKYAGAFRSSGYKMLSANTKNKLAKIIASGDVKKIEFALSKIVAALKNSGENKIDQ